MRNLQSDSIARLLFTTLAWLPLMASMTGCAFVERFLPHRAAPCALQPGATYPQIVAKVNQNFASQTSPPLEAWQCTDVWMSVKGMPGLAHATIAVEAPHQFRIRASNPLTGAEVTDLGANAEEIWFWEPNAPGVITASHEELPQFLRQMQVPFEPEWLMEVLGVVPIDQEQYELVRPTPETGYVDLVADRSAPTGEPVRRVIRIDTCRGQVLEHRVQSIDGSLIAVARMGEYEKDASGRYSLPKSIELEWPQANMRMRFHLRGQIETDPQRFPGSSWSVPRINGYAQLRVGPPQAQPVGETTGILTGDGQRASRARITHPLLTEDAPPEEYFEAASQSSSDPPLREPESGPRPFP